MSIATSFTIALVVDTMFALAVSCAVYVALNLIIWSWLAFVLSLIASLFTDHIPGVLAAKQHAYNAAVAGTAKALGWWNSRATAKVTA